MLLNAMTLTLKYGSTAPGWTFFLILFLLSLLGIGMSCLKRRYARQTLICILVSCALCNNGPSGAAAYIWLKNKELPVSGKERV